MIAMNPSVARHHNRLDTPKEPGYGAVEDEGEGVVVGTEGGWVDGKQKKEVEDPLPPKKSARTKRGP